MNPTREDTLFALALEQCGASAGKFLQIEAAKTFSRPLRRPDRTRRPLPFERRLDQAAGKIAGAMNQAFGEQRLRVIPMENQMPVEGRVDAEGANPGKFGPSLESRAAQPRTFLATNCCSSLGSVISMPEKSKGALRLLNLIYLP